MYTLGAVILLSYLIGSIPVSLIAGKLWAGIDIREHGSGNAGSANVFRVLGWKLGVIVVVLDLLKGFCTVIYVSQINFGDAIPGQEVIKISAGCSVVIGNIWTIFAGFKGGKGALSTTGVYLGLAPLTTVACIVIFMIMTLTTRYVSVGSLTAAVGLTVITVGRKFWLHHPIGYPMIIVTLFVTLLIIYSHRSNIKRLLNGTENRFGKK